MFVHLWVCFTLCSPLGLVHPLFTFEFVSPFVQLWVCFILCSPFSLFHPLFTFVFVSPFVHLWVCFTLCSPLSLFHPLFTFKFVSPFVHLTVCFTLCLPFNLFHTFQLFHPLPKGDTVKIHGWLFKAILSKISWMVTCFYKGKYLPYKGNTFIKTFKILIQNSRVNVWFIDSLL